MVSLTYLFLDMLKSHPRANIINLSSMEATLPLPYKVTYTATKSFVYAFSLALREELMPTNVRVGVVCPGPVVTNEEGMQRMKAHGWRGKLMSMTADEVADTVYQGIQKDKQVIIPGVLPTLIVKFLSLVPPKPKMKILEKIFRVYK